MQAGSAEKFSIKVWLEFFKQGPVDLDQVFKRDRDRVHKFSGRVCSKNSRQGPVPEFSDAIIAAIKHFQQGPAGKFLRPSWLRSS